MPTRNDIVEIGGAAINNIHLAMRRKQPNGTVADVTVTLNLPKADVRRQVLNYMMTTSALVVLLAPGHHYTAASSLMDCWRTASKQTYTDEQQLAQGKHFMLSQPYSSTLHTVEPWITVAKDDRTKRMMYRRNVLESQEPPVQNAVHKHSSVHG